VQNIDVKKQDQLKILPDKGDATSCINCLFWCMWTTLVMVRSYKSQKMGLGVT